MELTCPNCGGLNAPPSVAGKPVVCVYCRGVIRHEAGLEHAVLIPWDKIECKLHAERVIASDSVRVYVQATLSLSGEEPARVRSMVSDALAGVLDGAWRFSSIDRREDGSGLERIVTVASVRVPEQATGGLVERLKKACRPGLRLELKELSTRPPKKEIDAARVELRKDLYRNAGREAETLNAMLPSDTRPWRVGSISIIEELNTPQTRQRELVRRAMGSMSYSEGVPTEETENVDSVSELRLTATVELRRPSVPDPPAGYFAGGVE